LDKEREGEQKFHALNSASLLTTSLGRSNVDMLILRWNGENLMRIAVPIVAVLLGLTLVSCPTQEASAPKLAEIRYWATQLQGIDEDGAVDEIVSSAYDMVVIEPTCTVVSYGKTSSFDTADVVSRIKESKGHDGTSRKLALAYVNIGEAEDWRWYWSWSKDWPSGTARPSDWPSYILKKDPDGWTGDYPVAYWNSTWKNVVIYGVENSGQRYGSMLDEVIQDGFDGVCLDWVAAFEDSDVYAAARAAGKDAADEMLKLLKEIRAYAEQRGKTNFIIVQQNGSTLIDSNPELISSPSVIDGILQEGIWYYGDAVDDWSDSAGYDIKTDPLLTTFYIEHLKKIKDAGVAVLACEYAFNFASSAYSRADCYGFIPYVSRTPLSQLSTTPPPDLE
jgi:cysteinyl-tRNA synthetase